VYEINITAQDANRRADKFLFMYFNNAPHSLIYKLLRKKRIKLNGKRAAGSELLQAGDVLGLYLSGETMNDLRTQRIVESSALPEIIYEDEDYLIVNKPAGMASHGGMKGKEAHLLARVLHYLRETGAYPPDATFTPALCNRLDVNTSGLIVCGKNYQSIRTANALFAAQGSVIKEYLTIVDGELHGSATLEGHYQKDTAANIARINNTASEPRAITAYKSLDIKNGHTLLSVNPITGRSHQIRAHLASIGHPLSGDKKYGGKAVPGIPGQLLHCHRLIFPDGKTWTVPPPETFIKHLTKWKLRLP